MHANVLVASIFLIGGPSAMAHFLPIPYPFCAVGTLCFAIPSREVWEAGLHSTFRQATMWLMFWGAIAIWVAGAWIGHFIEVSSPGNPLG